MTDFSAPLQRLTAVAALVLSLALTAGCASAPDGPSLFVLDTGSDTSSPASRPGAPTLMIAPVDTASYLDQGGIVYQTGPHRVAIANSNRWASPLAGQLTDALYTTLDRRLTGVNIVRADSQQAGRYQLRTHVDRFLGHYDGKAHIAGRWILVGPNGQTLAHRSFTRGIPLKTDGYPALVNSLSSGWRTIGQDMAPTLERLLGAPSSS